MKIYQIFYDSKQLTSLDPHFIPYSNIENKRPEWREWYIFNEAYKAGIHKNSSYVGLLSWKFRQKTGLSGEEFIKQLKNAPKADVYFVNPFKGEEILFKNVWIQGDKCHKGLIGFTDQMFKDLNINIDIKKLQMGSKTSAFCNYWVGNEKFWDEYMKFTRPMFDYMENQTTKKQKQFLYQRADKIIDATYHSFIMERMFSTLITTNPNLTYHKIPL